MIQIKTSEATPLQLNWLVGICEGYKPEWDALCKTVERACTDGGWEILRYTTDWSQGGPIIEREEILLDPFDTQDGWLAIAKGNELFGETPLIAAMRCYVASKLGDEVEIPEELCQIK